MLKITIRTDALQPMLDWLKQAKTEGVRDEARLLEILQMPDYQVEFARYGMEGLPVCGISYEEAVDFFLHFGQKKFANPRLREKRKSFLPFYENMEAATASLELFSSFSREEIGLIETLLKNGLPESLLQQDLDIRILLLISIGNSFGWPYENYIDFDAANLRLLDSKEALLHLIAHEVHHIFFSSLIPDEMKPEEYFLLNFAFEGLAVHFMNNHAFHGKPAKYPGGSFCMVQPDSALYEREFDALFAKFREDWARAKTMTLDQVTELIGRDYEQFSYTSLITGQVYQTSQYPTYFLGCYFFGLIDHVLGKERLFAALANPGVLADTYHEALRLAGDQKYRLF